MRRLREHLTYANVISTLSLFLVLGGGTAYAVTQLDDDSVESNHIVNGQVKSADVQNESSRYSADRGLQAVDLAPTSVGTSEVANDSLTGGDINEGTLSQVRDARTLDGKTVDQLAPGRIHAIGTNQDQRYTFIGPVPGLLYTTRCDSNELEVEFQTQDLTYFEESDKFGTANATWSARGIESPSANQGPVINVSNGSGLGGFPFTGGVVTVRMTNDTPAADQNFSGTAAQGELRLIIDVGARTYSIDLHMYHRVPDDARPNLYCEVLGTATFAEE